MQYISTVLIVALTKEKHKNITQNYKNNSMNETKGKMQTKD